MPKTSAGILLFKKINGKLQVLIGHPGGPFFKNKDEGAWSVIKGEIEEHEDPEKAALREFEEETGFRPAGNLIDLGTIKQKGGKVVHAFAMESDWPKHQPLKSNPFELEWPTRTGKKQQFPELDKTEFFAVREAKKKINSAQIPFLERLEDKFKTT